MIRTGDRKRSGGYGAIVHRDYSNAKGVAVAVWIPLKTVKSRPLLLADPQFFTDEKYTMGFS